MRFRTHLATSIALGLALYPRRPRRAAALIAAGTLIDLDHLLLYALQTGDWSIVGALRYDRYRHRGGLPGDTRPRYGPLRSWLHRPLLLLPPLWVAAASRPALRPVAIGLSAHLLLDQYDAPLRALEGLRAAGRCRACGRPGMRLDVHRFGPRGRRQYRALCQPCAQESARTGRLAASARARARLETQERLWYTTTAGRAAAAE
jgi:hypothetical protein